MVKLTFHYCITIQWGGGVPAGAGKWRASSHHCWGVATSRADTDVCRDARWSPGVPRWPSLSLSSSSSCLRALLTAELWAVTKRRPPGAKALTELQKLLQSPRLGSTLAASPAWPPALSHQLWLVRMQQRKHGRGTVSPPLPDLPLPAPLQLGRLLHPHFIPYSQNT